MKIFADGADLEQMELLSVSQKVEGFTTNQSLMRKSGIKDYKAFGKTMLELANGRPVSFEVLADEFGEMESQAREIASWGSNVFVKLPITTTRGEFSPDLIERLNDDGIHLNITAVLTRGQIVQATNALGDGEHILSVFAGRISDCGKDPTPTVRFAAVKAHKANTQVLWASARQAYDYVLAEEAGADIITLPMDLIAKLWMFGRDLEEYSLETVKQFHSDAQGITL